jgi:CHASE2 domain-containing sensor protein
MLFSWIKLEFYACFSRQIGVIMTFKRKKLIIIATFIVIAAVTIVICVGIFTRGQVSEYDGTLVRSYIENVNGI